MLLVPMGFVFAGISLDGSCQNGSKKLVPKANTVGSQVCCVWASEVNQSGGAG